MSHHRSPILVPVLALSLLGALPACQPAPIEADGDYAFVRASVVPLDREGVLEDHTVVVRGDRIVTVAPTDRVALSDGVVTIDASGRFLIPGLAEMHAHVSPSPATPAEETEETLFLFLANGITMIRGMLGAPHQLDLRAAIESGEVLGPTFVVGAPSLNGNSAPTPDDAERLVRAHADAGYDFLKIHPGIERQVWDHMVEVAREVEITFAGHVPADVGIRHALDTGISTVDHLDGYLEATRRAGLPEDATLRETFEATDVDRVRELAGLTREVGGRVVPTMYLWENFFDPVDVDSVLALPEMRYAPQPTREGWASQNRNRWAAQRAQSPDEDWTAAGRAHAEARVEILRALHEADVEVLMGTDAPQMFNVPGFSIHREIPIMARAGMTPHEILASGSRNVARYLEEELGLDGSFGTIVPGSRADLVLLDGDPLEDLSNLQRIEGVMVRGRWLPGQEIRATLESIAARHED